jgi:hypothetical protein
MNAAMPIDLTPIVKPINDVAEPLTNSLSDAWSAVLGDKIAAWRLRNAAEIQVKLHEELKRLGVSLDNAKIPERYAFTWFDEATKQDEPEIQELFARLLAKAAAGDKEAGDRRNLEILTRMTPMDAQVFHWIFEKCVNGRGAMIGREFVIWSLITKEFGAVAELALEHLIQLGLLEKHYGISGHSSSGRWVSVDSGMPLSTIIDHVQENTDIACELAASERGRSLYRACRSSLG